LALPVAAASAAGGPAFGLRIFTGNNPKFLVFHSAKCHIEKRYGFEAVASERGWRLRVRIRPFSGFRPYKLVRGYFNGTYISLDPPGSAGEYASDFVPPYHIPSGGQISFSNHGSIMGGGFYPMFNQAGTDAVGVAGGLTCHYPKRKRR
ncbi:MAG: hypothetical protein ACREP1_06925, partial [Rhodanobacteraceae bacterium]